MSRASLWAIALATAVGCGEPAPKSAATGGSTGGSTAGQTQYRTELLQSAMALLSAPEQFDNEEQASAQLVARLNQWLRLAREADPPLSIS